MQGSARQAAPTKRMRSERNAADDLVYVWLPTLAPARKTRGKRAGKAMTKPG